MLLKTFILCIQFASVYLLKFSQPVAQTIWQDRCSKNNFVLNDCNWCKCNKQHRYECEARDCSEVDMFGHFNDAIREINVGMEGHGVWRSSETACEPGVPYRRGQLLCICNEDGNWPNPTCRDVFRVLHSVIITKETNAHQKCEPTKLYLLGCNICFCPSTGKLNPKLCTKRICTENDPVTRGADGIDEPADSETEIYAECNTNQKYSMGCKNCVCLRNNRLLCDNCSSEVTQSVCQNKKPEDIFNIDCNLCFCDKDSVYCTVKKCLENNGLINELKMKPDYNLDVSKPYDDQECISDTRYGKDCNTCFCKDKGEVKTFGCTKKICDDDNSIDVIKRDCVKGTLYKANCIICYCDEIDNVKYEWCKIDRDCVNHVQKSNKLEDLQGYCDPLHVYEYNCNICKCSSDGKTVVCTSKICESNPVSVDLIPLKQDGRSCQNGGSYRIDCNFCFCLSNGNAICTTADCNKIK